MPGVDAAAAAVVDGGAGQNMLAVYVVSREASVTETTVKAYVAERLPKYMVPQVVQPLEALPLLPNDKLDRKRIAELATELRPSASTVAPTNGIVEDLETPSHEKQASLLAIIQREVAALLHLGDPAQVTP